MKNTQFLPLLLVVVQQLSSTWAFICPAGSTWRTTTQLSAKKKKSRVSAGEGFGKSAVVSESPSKSSSDNLSSEDGSGSAPRALQSINTASPTSDSSDNLYIDPNLSDEARSKAILRQKFGLKSYEEQQADLGDYRAIQEAEAKAAQREKLRNIENLWPEDKDFFAVLPPSVVRGIDTFLKTGLGLTTAAFITAGILITIEAGSKATGYELPAGLDEFVTNVVEPNFTPGLVVLLGFSVCLGVFTVSLGGSAASSYREDP
mmetsp:Transcript_18889/g.30960  ORF Transcript_18889/g.30960 Transcript_18889/m.30960 type:complete len:260 (+) Transcript_18889:109-888(+)|eukprot:scaffold1476_cov136-Skeletonema_menzelii.AAC.4